MYEDPNRDNLKKRGRGRKLIKHSVYLNAYFHDAFIFIHVRAEGQVCCLIIIMIISGRRKRGIQNLK